MQSVRVRCRPTFHDIGSRKVHARRWYSSTTPSQLLALLRRNPESNSEDAQRELRWIRQASKEDPKLSARHGSGSYDPSASLGLVKRRSEGEPSQYVSGTTDFGPLRLNIRAPTSIPRPETAYIVEQLVDRIQSAQTSSSAPSRVVDLCSGSGCIASLTKYHSGNHVDISGIDISSEAVSLARENATETGSDVKFQLGDLWNDNVFRDKVDMVISNPPYIPRSEWDDLDPSVKAYEDPLASVGDPQDVPDSTTPLGAAGGHSASDGKGLAFYRRIAASSPRAITPSRDVQAKGWVRSPRVAVEIGFGQAQDVQDILVHHSEGAVNTTEVWRDQYGVDRMVVGW